MFVNYDQQEIDPGVEIEEAAKLAARLWRFAYEFATYDNGDNSVGGVVTAAMASSLPNNATAEKLQDFEEALRVEIEQKLFESQREDGVGFYLCTAVDYGPDETLSKALEAAEIKMESPWKHTMWLYPGKIDFRHGYSAAITSYYLYEDTNADGETVFKWFEAKLSGGDVGKIIDMVRLGIIGSEWVDSLVSFTGH